MKKITIYITLGIAAFTVLTGCYSINTHEVKYPQASQGFEPKRTYDASADKAWKAVNDALDRNRVAVVSSDQAAGRIQTDTVAGENSVMVLGGGTFYRYGYNIRLTPEDGGKTKIAVICKLESMFQTSRSTRPFTDVSPEHQPTVKALENWLYEEIEKSLKP